MNEKNDMALGFSDSVIVTPSALGVFKSIKRVVAEAVKSSVLASTVDHENFDSRMLAQQFQIVPKDFVVDFIEAG